MGFKQIVSHVNESVSLSDKEVHFLVSELESKYVNLLHEKGINYTTDVTRFTDELLEAIPKFEKRRMNGKVGLILTSNVDDNLLEEVINAGYFAYKKGHITSIEYL